MCILRNREVLYLYTKAQQNLAALLEQAYIEGEVQIKRQDGIIFRVKPMPKTRSPFDVEGINVSISRDEIVEYIREGKSFSKQDAIP